MLFKHSGDNRTAAGSKTRSASASRLGIMALGPRLRPEQIAADRGFAARARTLHAMDFAPAAGDDGGPTWSIFDPIRNAYFRIGWAARKILVRWGLGRGGAVAEAVNNQTTLTINF